MNEEGALRDFIEIDDMLTGYWRVWRGGSRGMSARQIFDILKNEFTEFSWRGPINLLNFPKSGTGLRLETCLAKLQGIKRKRGFPLMTVSEFLHFYNPGLFPIYDNKMIWDRILNDRFKGDFRAFCERQRIPDNIAGNSAEDTAVFLRHYMCFASELLSVRHPTFMQVFTDWLDRQPGTKLPKRTCDGATLYATAFEFTAIGASAV